MTPAKVQATENEVAPEVLALKERSVTIDGVIEVSRHLDAKTFFDGLLDAIIDYVEQHQAFAGLSMSHQEYADEDDSDNNTHLQSLISNLQSP